MNRPVGPIGTWACMTCDADNWRNRDYCAECGEPREPRCEICERPIARGRGLPLCDPCEGAAREVGKQAAEAMRQESTTNL